MAEREPASAGTSGDDAAPWVCPTCAAPAQTPYCATCGERRLRARDINVTGLLGQAVEALTNTDGRLFRTCYALVLRPGELTAAYMRGERKRYIAPFQLFLIANVAFFLAQSVLGVQVFSTPLASQLKGQVYSELAAELTADRLAAAAISMQEYAAPFDQAVIVNAKALVVLLVPLLALLAFVLNPALNRPAVTHFAFGLHFVAFWLLLFAALMPLLGVPIAIVLSAITRSDALFDAIFTWIFIGVCAVYAYYALGTVYGGPAWARVLKAALFAFLLIPLMRIYRFAVFLITLYTT